MMFFKKNFYSSLGSGPASCISHPSLCYSKLDGRRLKRSKECDGVLGGNRALMFTLASCLLLCGLSGCGSNYTVTAAGIGAFQASSDAVEFGNVQVGQTASSTLTLVNQGSAAVSVSDLKITGKEFTIANSNTLPVTVAANSSYNL